MRTGRALLLLSLAFSVAGVMAAPGAAVASPASSGGRSAVDVARGELGAREEPSGSNTGPRVRVYLAPLGVAAAPWCAAFVSYCLRAAGVAVLPYTARVAVLVSSARAAGRWRERAEHDPRPGDLAVFKRSGQDPRAGGDGHVAIIESVTSASFMAIGGNEGDSVQRTERGRDDEALVGWISLPEAA